MQVELLPQADVVVVLDGGAVTHCGPYDATVAERFGGPRPAEYLASADSQLAEAVGDVRLRSTSTNSGGVPFDDVLRIVDHATGSPVHTAVRTRSTSKLNPRLAHQSTAASEDDAGLPPPASAHQESFGGATTGLSLIRGEELHTLERAYSIRATTITSLTSGGAALVNVPPAGSAAAAARLRAESGVLPSSAIHPASPSKRELRAVSNAVDPDSVPNPAANIKLLDTRRGLRTRTKRPAPTQVRSAGPYKALLREVGYILALTSFFIFVMTQLVRIFSDYWSEF